MSRAAITMFVWGIYLSVLSATLLIAPNVLLGLFGIPSTTEVWIRLVGMFLVFFSYLSFASARTEDAAYMRRSGYIRASVILFFGAFVGLGMAPPVLLLFGVVDLAAACWTLWALGQPRAAAPVA